MPQSIYISGTYADLKTYRKAAALTVEDFGFRAKDSYTAGPAPVVESCLADVDGCDAFLGIVGLTYGWVPPDGDRRSITHREFDRAEGKKRLIFVLDAQADLAPEIQGFRDSFGGKVRAARFSSEDDFVKKVRDSLKENFGARPDGFNPRVLPYFCDRRLQYERIDDILWARKNAGSAKLLMLVVHGDQYQSGSQFLEVLAHRFPDYPAVKGAAPPVTFRPEWPAGAASAEEFREQFQRAIGLAVMNDRHASRSDLEKRLLAIDAPVLFHTRIDSSLWKRCGRDAAAAFFRFWDEWSALARLLPIATVLQVEYEEMEPSFSNWLRRRTLDRTNGEIRGFLNRPFQPAQSILEVLPELPRVPRQEVIAWSHTPVVQRFAKDANLEPAINEIFQQRFAGEPGEGPRMEPLAKELAEMLRTRI